MTRTCSSLRRTTRLSAIVALVVIVFTASAASAQTPLGSAENFALLAGTAVTCTNSTVTGDVGVWPGTAITQTLCTVVGTVHPADSVARRAFMDFMTAYTSLEENPPDCDATLTGTLAGETLLPGVYCVDATAKTGLLTLDAQGNRNAVWLFLVDGALTGTSFNVVMINGGQPCNVDWWVRQAATLTDSRFLGNILAGAAITITRETFTGHALAAAGVTVTGATVSVCRSTTPPGDDCKKPHDRCCKCKCKCRTHHDDKDHKDRDCDRDHDKDRNDKDGDRDHDKDRNDRDGDRDHDKDRRDQDSKDKKSKDHGSKNRR